MTYQPGYQSTYPSYQPGYQSTYPSYQPTYPLYYAQPSSQPTFMTQPAYSYPHPSTFFTQPSSVPPPVVVLQPVLNHQTSIVNTSNVNTSNNFFMQPHDAQSNFNPTVANYSTSRQGRG